MPAGMHPEGSPDLCKVAQLANLECLDRIADSVKEGPDAGEDEQEVRHAGDQEHDPDQHADGCDRRKSNSGG
jgi:hypothetical protein